MYIKIYFNDKPLFLCDRMTDEISVYAHHDDAVLIDEFSPHAVNAMVHEMRQAKVHAGIFIHSDVAALKKAFWKKFLIIQAGGGLSPTTGRSICSYSGGGNGTCRRGSWTRARRWSSVRSGR
ncbi:hypothetical protein ACQ86N_24610 [Puia sp. P3]|uniref:hypothetical protein n=1 Tax=Puia sp. P3 TaxID=3423952 RepID=UPI003D677A96